MALSIEELLNRSRQELLDLSTRNRLLSLPVASKSARIICVHDELSEQVYRQLVTEKKALSFLPGVASKPANGGIVETPAGAGRAETTAVLNGPLDEEEAGLPQPEDDEAGPDGVAKRHRDLRLQTALTPEGLQRRLLDLYRDARTMIEEQGVNVLYLALGQLKWFEADQADTPRFAPLILVPVELQRKTAAERFYLRWREEEIEENLSLRAKLKADCGVELPDFPDEEELSPDKYCAAVARAVAGAKGWEVLPNAITLGFFSFAKFLMYRDLDPENWPDGSRLTEHPHIAALLRDGFPAPEPLIPEDANLDEVIPAARLDHVVDADSSQTQAIELVRLGRSLVIQGPPGTGKSQSITNLIATAVLEGKKVLFVAEKLAALEVVKRRLEREGLGPLCLELHSNKANKRAVVEEIARTWKLGRPKATDLEKLVPQLEKRRAQLNEHARRLHTPLMPGGFSPFLIMGHLTALGERGRELADLSFAGAEEWSPEDCAERRQLAEELAGRVREIGPAARHVWRGVGRETVLNIDLAPLAERIRDLAGRLASAQAASAALAEALGQPAPETLAALEAQRVIGEFVAQAPPVDRKALGHDVWNGSLEGLQELIRVGRGYAEARARLGAQVVETVWDEDFAPVRVAIAAHGQSWLRFLNGDYRRALARLRGSLKVELTKRYSERVALVDQIIAGQRALKAVREGRALGEAAWGTFWAGDQTDWHQAEQILEWVRRQREAGLDAAFRRMFASVRDPQAVGPLTARLGEFLVAARTALEAMAEELKLDPGVAFDMTDLAQVPVETLRDRCSGWLEAMEELVRWNQYFLRAREARALGLAPLVDRLEAGTLSPDAARDGFDRVYFSQLLRAAVRAQPELARFDGALHSRRVEEFRELDRERLALAKFRVLLAHCEGLPPNSGVGPAGIVKSETERKRGHRSVRRLLKEAGSVVQAIKPVFMMSPLSVAQFLAPGAVEFDLLVVDEASQVEPVDALGAIARCRQIVVVGDSRQLPPTRFFLRLTSDAPPEKEDAAVPQAAQAQDMESILGLCVARGLPQAMLRWHYRSRHHSLIAVSNHEFYEDRLFVVPSPQRAAADLGLRFHYLPEGVYDAGGSGANRIEGKAVCRAVMEHAQRCPELSLGVAAFSIRQQQAILDELELLRREQPELETFFNNHPAEPFFVKNLENVQGDERDVIFISVGYGRDVHGFLAMRFGPLSTEGGERRLNVLISRAKRRCEVFSGITAEDIDLARASGRGVAALKTFLAFAQTGELHVAKPTGREEQSVFEEAVRRAIESLGHEVHPQVGIAGFFVDLAVVDREQPGRYLLGIECDGAAYHASRSARDRDRLRQAVLEDHGWIIHRIWSTDWFQRPAEQLRRVAEAIERARQTRRAAAAAPVEVGLPPSPDSPEIEREAVPEVEDHGLDSLAAPYVEARFAVPKNREPHELSARELEAILLRIVQLEGPLHEDELAVRVRELWGLGRTGARIQDAVAKAARALLIAGKCVREQGFLSLPGAPVVVRNREQVQSANLRKPDLLPPAEIRAAILALIDAHHGAGGREIPAAVARLLGFKATSANLREVIAAQLKKLRQQGVIEETDGMYKRAAG